MWVERRLELISRAERMRALLLVGRACLRRVLQDRTDDKRVPFEHRPKVRLKNIKTRQYRSQLPNSFYTYPDGRTVVLVYGDIIVEHEFDEPARFKAEVQSLQMQGVKQVDILLGVLKIIVGLTSFAIFLKLLLLLKILI